jgi:phage terminase large subunit GpA-like protein
MTSYNSIAKLKSFSWDFIVMDEIIEAPPEIESQGDVETIIEARGKTIRDLKVVKLSTPTAAGGDRIYRAFKSGDRREYMIPCPRCGEFQHLEFMKETLTWGLYGDYDTDKRGKASLVPGTARYKCRHCGKDFFEHEKEKFMLCRELGGEAYWEPRGTAQDVRDRSYHISAMMSPMTEWANIVTDYLKTDMGKKLQDYRNFIITNEGLHPETDKRFIVWDELRARAEAYHVGKPPEGPLVITGGVDVHKNRLILHLVAWGPGMEAWSFDRRDFFGQTADINSRAWQDLKAYCEKTFVIPSLGDMEANISKVCLDISYNPSKDPTLDEQLRSEKNSAFLFCSRNRDIFTPVKGISDDLKSSGFTVMQKKNSTYDMIYYLVDVSAIKDEIFTNIDTGEGPRAVHFTNEYPDACFEEFCSEIYGEDPQTGKVGYYRIHANEMLDTFVYATAAMHVCNFNTWDEDKWLAFKATVLEE